MSEVFNPADAEFWVLVALITFFVLLFLIGVPKKALAAIDGRRQAIQDELDEAARIRADAQALLEQIKQKRLETERQANEMLANAEAEARRLEIEARAAPRGEPEAPRGAGRAQDRPGRGPGRRRRQGRRGGRRRPAGRAGPEAAG